MNSADFRSELEKKMPGYKWTVHRTDNPARLEATGIQSSGFNRLSTLKVSRMDEGKTAWYEVMSAGHGTRSPWAGRAGNITLARALRDLQTHYQRKASSYQSLANRLEEGRRSEPELSQPSIEGP